MALHLLTDEDRRQRLERAAERVGGKAQLGRVLGYKDGAFVGQMIRGERPISEKTIRQLIEVPHLSDLFFFTAGPEGFAPGMRSAANNEGPSADAAIKPIHAWEYEEDLPPGDYAMVPRLEIKLSAGPGSGANQLAFDFDDGQLRAYSADWIRRNHLKPNKLRVMKAAGRSMEPTIFDGDDLLINLAETEIIDGRVYALWYEGGERVKRLYRMPGGGLRIRSDNEREFPEIVLGPEYAGHVRVIGRVIDRSGAGGL